MGDVQTSRTEKEHDEMFKNRSVLGHMAIKASIVLNGAAAVAVLAFIGNVMSKDKPLPLVETGIDLVLPISLFVGGAVAGGLQAGAAYVEQQAYLRENWKWYTSWLYRTRAYWTFATGTLFLGAMGAFLGGAMLTAITLTDGLRKAANQTPAAHVAAIEVSLQERRAKVAVISAEIKALEAAQKALAAQKPE